MNTDRDIQHAQAFPANRIHVYRDKLGGITVALDRSYGYANSATIHDQEITPVERWARFLVRETTSRIALGQLGNNNSNVEVYEEHQT